MAFKMTGDGGNGGGSAPIDADDFIFSKWGPFASDQGFVANQAPSVGTAPNREYWTWQGTVGSPVAPFIFLDTATDSIQAYTGHTSVDTSGDEELFDQPNNPNNGPLGPVNINVAGGPWSSHYLFANVAGDYIHAVAQVSARRWRHLLCGVIPDANKYGAWVGGTYQFGTDWSQVTSDIDNPYSTNHAGLGCMGDRIESERPQRQGCLHCEGLVTDVDWFLNTTRPIGNPTINPFTGGGGVNPQTAMGVMLASGVGISFGGALKRLGASLISRNTVLVPVTIFAKSNFAGNVGFAALGTLPDVFFVNMRDFAPGEAITVGSDTFRVFPIVNSNTVETQADEEYSGYEGLAYKVIP